MIEGTAPAIVLQRGDSPNLSQPALSDSQVVRVYCRQSGERFSESHLCKTMAGAVPSIIDIYYLVPSNQQFYTFSYILFTRGFSFCSFKGIVSQDFGGLQIIFMHRAWVLDVSLEVY